MSFRLRIFRLIVGPALVVATGNGGRLAAATRYQTDPTFAAPLLTQPMTGQIYAQPLADGGVLASGDFTWAGGQAAGPVVRLNADGTLQTSNWLASATAAGVLGVGRPPRMCQLADGRILVAVPVGSVPPPLGGANNTVTILRFSTSGVLDTGFKLTLTPPVGDTASVSGLWPLPSGQIIVTGHFVVAGGHLTRDAAALAVDGTINPFYASQTDFTGPLAVASDGALYGTVPSASSIGSSLSSVVVRLDGTGALANRWTVPTPSGLPLGPIAISASGDAFVAATGANGVTVIESASTVTPRDLPTTPVIYRLQQGVATPAVFFATTSLPASVTTIQPLADGGLILVGVLPQLIPGQPAGLLRLNADGTPNLLFSPPTLAGVTVESLQPLSDGWLAVLASGQGQSGTMLRKLDAAFGLRPDFRADLRASSFPLAAWPLPDGSLILQGNFANGTGQAQRFVRLRANGVLDDSHVPLAPETTAASIATVDAAGRVYVTGAFFGLGLTVLDDATPTGPVAGGPTAAAIGAASDRSERVTPTPLVEAAVTALTGAQIERFSIDGVPDAGFGRPALPEATDTIEVVQVDPQNRVLLAGTTTAAAQSRIVRLLPSGAVDPGFNFTLALGTNRVASVTIASSGSGYLLADGGGNVFSLQDDGTAPSAAAIFNARYLQRLTLGTAGLFAIGGFNSVLGNPSPAVARLLPSGLPDPSWHFEGAAGSNGSAVQPLPDGRLLVSGDLLLTGQRGVANEILTGTGAVDLNESLPGAALIITAAADGSLYSFQSDGSIQRLVAVSRVDYSLSATGSAVTVGTTVQFDLGGGGILANPVTWLHNGQVVPGASGPELTLVTSASSDSGWYTAVVATPAGPTYVNAYLSVVATSARIANASARAYLGPGDSAQTIGFVATGTSSEPALLRITTDGLTQFGLGNVSSSPLWTINIAGSALQPQNYIGVFPSYTGIETISNAALIAGAFPFPASANDPQLLISPAPGVSYTIQRTAAAAQSGVTLLELYFPETSASLASGRRLVNFSCRAAVGQGDQLFVVGFVVAGNQSLPVLVRGLGPALARFGVAEALDQPVLTVYQGQTVVGSNAGWQNQTSSAQVAAAAARAGAFALSAGADSALLLTLAPGAYTAVLQSNDPVGVVGMIELYDASN